MTMQSSTAAGSSNLRFTVKSYRPDGGSGPSGTAMILLALIASGALLGFIVHWIAQYFYLILMFPLGIGLAMGFAGSYMAQKCRVRNPLVGGAAGFLGGVLAMFMMHYFDYRDFKKMDPEFRELAMASPAEQKKVVETSVEPGDREKVYEALKIARVRNMLNMLDYMNLQAERGVEIKKAGSSTDHPLNLGFIGSWIYWIIEVLIVAGMTYYIVRNQTRQPFCVRCDRWKKAQVIGWLGGEPTMVATAAQAGELGTLRSLSPSPQTGQIRVTMACCDRCTGTSGLDLKFERVTVNKKGESKSKQIAHVTYPTEAQLPLKDLFNPPQPASAASQ